MKRLLRITVLAVALVGVLAMRGGQAVQALSPSDDTTVAAGGACNCPKGQVCCFNCNGTFAYCARSHAFCPECPAP